MLAYPVELIGLAGRRVVVIGGGAIAARKVRGLLDAGASIVVISPELIPELAASLSGAPVTWLCRRYEHGDLAGAFLVIAATSDRSINEAVSLEAAEHGCLVNVVDDPALSNFIMPAVVRRGEVTVSISTGGASPALARRLRERLEAEIGPEYGQLAAIMASMRDELRARCPDGGTRLRIALALVDSDLLDVLRTEGLTTARQRAHDLLGALLESRAPETLA